jgi:NAD(P)-dependent dehydrogenase (short-subunit alcohol dehydrogenase family)
MQMEAGAQPESGAESPLLKIDPKYPDIDPTKWYEYRVLRDHKPAHRSRAYLGEHMKSRLDRVSAGLLLPAARFEVSRSSAAINAALEALARGLPLEPAPPRVNAVSHGLIETPLWDGSSE